MNSFLAIIKNGRVEVDAPPDWPEGSTVRVELERSTCDDERPETSEEIEAWIRRFRALEPVELTGAEEADWKAALKEQREFDIAAAPERDRRIADISE